jgi:hypothetical protein
MKCIPSAVETVAAGALSLLAGGRPHPVPLTTEDLDGRINRLEEDRQQFTAIIQAINTLSQAVAPKFQFFRDAIIEHREQAAASLSW